ncbi:hypothetical protein LEL_06691 [Akanthomyces lecanii RCEF 1005]|uniref:Uncharacterized protein n=1 Tax=Akanthomyces lecanii RCEF 1005 TaxID=1081108 RepID=A0A168GWG2_CORDF|nr:hypothetical protein LEL_06691 [Akanthomyces lecanii RCEF 1005]
MRYRQLFAAAQPILAVGAVIHVQAAAQGIDNTQPFGENPIRSFRTEYLGAQLSANSCNERDLGFAGHIQGKWFGVYGDNIGCAPGVHDPDQGDHVAHNFVRDSVAALTDNPLLVVDQNLDARGYPQQFTPWISWWGETAETGFGGTSVVETDWDSATGAIYYLINQHEDYAHAGIGKVQIQNGSLRMIERLGANGWWWDTNKTAKWGDTCAYRDERGEYIYLLGNPPQGQKGVAAQYIYQARVKATEAFDLSRYEYWWGRQRGWRSELLDTFNAETAVMWGAGQGSMVYSNFYNCYFYVHTYFTGKVLIRTAPSPEGPWTADVEVYSTTPFKDYIYAGVAYPYLDIGSKTLTMAYTNHNHIEVIKTTFY